MPPGIILLQEKTATYLSSDKQTNAARCSVIVTIDLLQLIKATQPLSDEQVAQAKQNAVKTGQETFKDNLVNYTVQLLHRVTATSRCCLERGTSSLLGRRALHQRDYARLFRAFKVTTRHADASLRMNPYGRR